MRLTKASLIFFLLFSYLDVHCQNALGLKVGTQRTSWSVDPEFSSKRNNSEIKVGFVFGAAFEISLSDLIAIQSEFLYTQKGAKFTTNQYLITSPFADSFDIVPAKHKISFNYLELPMLLKLKFGDLDETSFFLIVGPSFGYGINGKSESVNIGQSETSTKDFKFKERNDLNQFEISAVFGAGVGLPLTFGKLTFETRYLIGLSKFQNIDGSNKNRGLGISLGYMIPVSCKKKE